MSKAYNLNRSLSEKQACMLSDDLHVDVTPLEVKNLLSLLKRLKCPHSVIVDIRKKYDDFIDDPEKRLRARLYLH